MDIQQSAGVSVLVNAVIGMAQPVGAQDADIETVLFFHNLMIPCREIDVKIKTCDDISGIISPINKSSAHDFLLSLQPMCLRESAGTPALRFSYILS